MLARFFKRKDSKDFKVQEIEEENKIDRSYLKVNWMKHKIYTIQEEPEKELAACADYNDDIQRKIKI